MNTPRKPDDDLDRLLDDGGGELGALYRRLPRSDPPRRLDRAVLGNAARAVRGRPPRRHRWVVGLGSAAGLVLAAGIAWHVGQDALRQQSAPAAEKPAYVPVQPISEDARKRHAVANQAADAGSTQSAPAAQAPAPSERAEEKQKLRSAPRKPAAETALQKENDTAVAKSVSAPVAAPPPPPPPPAGLAAPQPPAPAPFPAAADKAAAGGNASGATRSAAKQETEAAAAEPSMRGAAPAPSGSVELRRDTQLAPDAWLAHIRQLFQQGRRQQAIESLRLFRRMHPDWVISDEWRTLSD